MSLLVVRVEESDIDLASDWLWTLGATAIEERSGELIAGFPDADQALAVRSVIEERWPTRFELPPDEAEWRDVWLKHLQPVSVGPLVIHPPWITPARDAVLPISIDPGRAFGSGHHESTQLAILALQEVLEEVPNPTVLDVGCGTGVLAVAASALGARRVLGIDVDLDITELARTNAEANGQEPPAVQFSTEDIADVEKRYDIVVANMTIGTVSPLLADIASTARGPLILSGLLHDHLPRVNATFGRNPVHTWANGAWVAARWNLA